MKTDNIIIRVSSIEKERWKEEAEKRGQTVSEFIRFCVDLRIEADKAK